MKVILSSVTVAATKSSPLIEKTKRDFEKARAKRKEMEETLRKMKAAPNAKEKSQKRKIEVFKQRLTQFIQNGPYARNKKEAKFAS